MLHSTVIHSQKPGLKYLPHGPLFDVARGIVCLQNEVPVEDSAFITKPGSLMGRG